MKNIRIIQGRSPIPVRPHDVFGYTYIKAEPVVDKKDEKEKIMGFENIPNILAKMKPRG